MELDYQFQNMLFTFIRSFASMLIGVGLIWFISNFLIEKITNEKSKNKKTIFGYVVLLSLIVSTYITFYGSSGPRIKHQSTYVPDGSELTVGEIRKTGPLIDSPTMDELKKDTQDDEAVSNRYFDERNINLNGD